MKQDFLTPVGRIVQGDAFKPQTTDQLGNPLTVKSGPNTGQATQRYYIGVAFPKTDAAFQAFYAKLIEVARASWPQHFNAQGQCTHPKMSLKVIDGDGVDDNGKPNNTKEGFAGHWVVKFSSSFAPRCFYLGHYQPHEAIQDPNAIQRGYYVRVAGTIEGNGNQQKPGLYVNLGMIELNRGEPGDIIRTGPDAAAVFGGGAAPAASPLPMPGAAPNLPTPGGFAPPVATSMPTLPQPAQPAAMPSPIPVVPNPAFVAGPPAAPAAPVGPQMTAKAGGFTYEQYRAQGWTDDQLRQQGMML